MDDPEFQELYTQHDRFLRVQAAKILRARPNDIDDVLQQAWLKVYVYRHTFRNDGSGTIRTWLTSIVRNEALNTLRSAKCHALDKAGPLECESATGEAVQVDLADQRDDFAAVRARMDVATVLSRLSPISRSAIVAHLEGLSHAETVEALGIKLRTMKTRLHNAKKQARRIMTTLPEQRPALTASPLQGDKRPCQDCKAVDRFRFEDTPASAPVPLCRWCLEARGKASKKAAIQDTRGRARPVLTKTCRCGGPDGTGCAVQFETLASATLYAPGHKPVKPRRNLEDVRAASRARQGFPDAPTGLQAPLRNDLEVRPELCTEVRAAPLEVSSTSRAPKTEPETEPETFAIRLTEPAMNALWAGLVPTDKARLMELFLAERLA